MFQFHIGAIRRSYPGAPDMEETGFNSILVQLEATMEQVINPLLLRFNSILVQLEGQDQQPVRPCMRSFNSILVQLEVGRSPVSISR